MPNNRELIEIGDQRQLGNYRPAPFVLTRGQGCRLEDVEGRRYLDLAAGIAVCAVGHGHPKLAKAIGEQAARLMHVSNLFYNDKAIALSDALAQRTGFDHFYFSNSGAEAIETLLKLARRYYYGRGETERVELIAAHNSFHGRTMGALSLTGQPKYHEGMGPLVGGIHHVPFGDLDAVRRAVGPRTAAVLLEPIQGEGGVVIPAPDYLPGVRRICDEAGALLFFDEIQTCYGRTGKFLAREHSGVWPDACALAKGIAGGFPLGAVAAAPKLYGALPPGSHATTFGGNPLACAAALSVLEIFDEEDLVARAAARGAYLHRRLAQLVEAGDLPVETTRGEGLLRGLVLRESVDPLAVLRRLQEEGVLLSLSGGRVLRFTPPLVVSESDLDEGIEAVRRVLTDAPRVERKG
jgi:acetylornithine/N-succinyldiaminopimelate aminotransferase